MSSFPILLTIFLGGLVAVGVAYNVFSLLSLLQFFDGRKPGGSGSDRLPPVSILKPVKGIDSSCLDNLATWCSLDYPEYEVLFGVRDHGDPVVPLVRRLVDSSGGRGRLVFTEETAGAGANEKVLNCIALAEEARYPLLLLSDSDMAAERNFLRNVVAEHGGLESPGMITCLYKTSAPRSVGSALESLAIAVDFTPSVLVARRIEGVTFGLGASMLFTTAALDRIGGLAPLAEFLADDYQLGFRFDKAGYRNELSTQVLENRVGKMGLVDHLIHQIRWARTQRVSRPWGFLGYGATHVFAFALLLELVAPGPTSLVVLLLVLALRYLLAATLYVKVIRKPIWLKWLFLLPLHDCLAFLVWVWSFAGTRVRWRGNAFRIVKGGRMVRARQ